MKNKKKKLVFNNFLRIHPIPITSQYYLHAKNDSNDVMNNISLFLSSNEKYYPPYLSNHVPIPVTYTKIIRTILTMLLPL